MKARLRPCKDGDQEYDLLWMWCPGCNEHHAVKVNVSYGWNWNGSLEKPTISPSILVSTTRPKGDQTEKFTKCHSFVTDGKIQFLSDSAHDLAGQTVDLPDLEE